MRDDLSPGSPKSARNWGDLSAGLTQISPDKGRLADGLTHEPCDFVMFRHTASLDISFFDRKVSLFGVSFFARIVHMREETEHPPGEPHNRALF